MDAEIRKDLLHFLAICKNYLFIVYDSNLKIVNTLSPASEFGGKPRKMKKDTDR